MRNKYYKEFEKLLLKTRDGKISKKEIQKYLIDNIDFEYVYDEDDSLLSDIFICLKHFASGEEDLTEREIEYLLKCLKGERIHSFEERAKDNID